MKVTGIVYPIPKEILTSLFENNKNIFIKFTTHEPSKKTIIKLKKGMTIYFYESHSNKCVVGDAIISNVDYLVLNEVLRIHNKKLMISKRSLKEYAKGREDKKLLVLTMKKINKYLIPKKTKKSITMAGCYINNENKKEIFE